MRYNRNFRPRGKMMFRRNYPPPRPMKRKILAIYENTDITKQVLKDRLAHLKTKATEVEKQALSLKSQMLELTEKIIGMKAQRVNLIQNPELLRLANLKHDEREAAEKKDYVLAHKLRMEIEQLEGGEEAAPVEAEMLT
mmetsp:Transcript_17098/g.30631  ORF Transcript_17098/g.30631 Transcript_17098/m.30631 type:complete len:139 (-) Transcript_17098:358-774(-)